MNQNKKVSRRIMIVSAGLVFSMAITPIQVSAAVSADVLQTAGVASILEASLSAEEYLAIAQQAQGALWGYTNLGIANVESGNLNVREQTSMHHSTCFSERYACITFCT